MDEVLYAVCSVMETVMETFVIVRLMGMFMDCRAGWKKYLTGIYAVKILVCILQNTIYPNIYVNLLVSVVTLFILTCFYDASALKKIAVVGIIIMCEGIAEWIAAVSMTLGEYPFPLREGGHNGDAFTLVVIAVMLWIQSEMIHSFRNIKKDLPVPGLLSGSIMLICAIMLVLQYIIFFQSARIEFIQLVSTVCMLLVLFLIVYLYDALSGMHVEQLHADMKEREKGYYYRQAELLQHHAETISAFRHDSVNHLYALRSMLDASDQEAGRYIDHLIGKMQNAEIYSSTGNIAIDSVINYKLGVAKERNIDVRAQIVLPEQMDLEMEDMVAILGNLLDNAIEAAEKAEDGRYVDIGMYYRAGALFLHVLNSYDGRLLIQKGEITTRKQEKSLHGIGLKSVKQAVEKYNGTMDIRHTGKEFTVKIMLYI